MHLKFIFFIIILIAMFFKVLSSNAQNADDGLLSTFDGVLETHVASQAGSRPFDYHDDYCLVSDRLVPRYTAEKVEVATCVIQGKDRAMNCPSLLDYANKEVSIVGLIEILPVTTSYGKDHQPKNKKIIILKKLS